MGYYCAQYTIFNILYLNPIALLHLVANAYASIYRASSDTNIQYLIYCTLKAKRFSRKQLLSIIGLAI